MPHSKMVIEVDLNLTGEVEVILRIEGCEEHLSKAITRLFLKHPKFKKLLNDAGKAANEITQREQN